MTIEVFDFTLWISVHFCFCIPSKSLTFHPSLNIGSMLNHIWILWISTWDVLIGLNQPENLGSEKRGHFSLTYIIFLRKIKIQRKIWKVFRTRKAEGSMKNKAINMTYKNQLLRGFIWTFKLLPYKVVPIPDQLYVESSNCSFISIDDCIEIFIIWHSPCYLIVIYVSISMISIACLGTLGISKPWTLNIDYKYSKEL